MKHALFISHNPHFPLTFCKKSKQKYTKKVCICNMYLPCSFFCLFSFFFFSCVFHVWPCVFALVLVSLPSSSSVILSSCSLMWCVYVPLSLNWCLFYPWALSCVPSLVYSWSDACPASLQNCLWNALCLPLWWWGSAVIQILRTCSLPLSLLHYISNRISTFLLSKM